MFKVMLIQQQVKNIKIIDKSWIIRLELTTKS